MIQPYHESKSLDIISTLTIFKYIKFHFSVWRLNFVKVFFGSTVSNLS